MITYERTLKKEAVELHSEALAVTKGIGRRNPTKVELREMDRKNALASLCEASIIHSERLTALEQRGSNGSNAPRKWAGGFGEFLQAVHRAADPADTRPIDPRLERRAAGLGEAVPSDGGFTVPQQFVPDFAGLIGYEAQL